jgi:hypothetical protein
MVYSLLVHRIFYCSVNNKVNTNDRARRASTFVFARLAAITRNRQRQSMAVVICRSKFRIHNQGDQRYLAAI